MRNIISFSKNKATFKMPHLLEVQLESYSQFTSKTIKDIFTELFPVADIHNRYQLVYNAHRFGSAKYLVNEAIEKGATYSVPLKVSFRLVSKEDGGDIKKIAEQKIYLCDMPVMTPRGTFIINGVERVVVSQIHRSPGVYFSDEQGTRTAMIIPYRGQWVEFIVDHTNTFYAILDRKRKLIGSMFLRSLGYETNEKILKLFYPTKEVDTRNSVNTISAEPIYDGDSLLFPAGELIEQPTAEVFKSKGIKKVKIIDSGHLGVGILANTFKKDRTSSQEEAAKKIYTLLRSMAPPTLDIAIAYIKNILFDANHFNLGDVGRFKLNMRLGLNERTHKMSLTEADLFETFRKLFQFTAGEFTADDIDHLGNRYHQRVCEVLDGQFRLALTQLIQNIKERASLMDEESL